jgi:hypothetical protein
MIVYFRIHLLCSCWNKHSKIVLRHGTRIILKTKEFCLFAKLVEFILLGAPCLIGNFSDTLVRPEV